jgi:hypothetical protein
MEEKLNATNVQVATVTKDGGFKILKEEEVTELMTSLA